MPASQEFRDGVSSAAREIVRRAVTVSAFGVAMSLGTLEEIADQLAGEYGGEDRFLPNAVFKQVFDRE